MINVCKFYEVFCEVEPKRRALNDANQMLQDAQTRLSNLVSKVAQLEETLADLTCRYTVSTCFPLVPYLLGCHYHVWSSNFTLAVYLIDMNFRGGEEMLFLLDKYKSHFLL